MARMATIILCIFILLFIQISFAQTTLSAGDIAIIGVNTDDPNDFAFVLLRDIEATTEINFTDKGWLAAGSFWPNEGIITYTAPSNLSAGTIIIYTDNLTDFSSPSESLPLDTDGDQLFAFQGPSTNPTFIYAVQTNSNVWQADATSDNDSALPTGLTNGTNAVAVGAGSGLGDEFDNAQYNGTTNFPTLAAALSAISNNANWVGNDATGYDFSTFGDFTLPVSLSSFIATAGDSKVILRWVTASEHENVGFKILRSTEKSGNYEQLATYENDPELEGQFNSSTQTQYKFEDQTVVNDVTYWYKLVDVDVNGVHNEHGPMSATPHPVGNDITTINVKPVGSFVLHPNYPNPFNPSTTLRFDIPALSSGESMVEMTIFNAQGQKAKTLFKGILTSGTHELTWKGDSDSGELVSSGTYFAILKMENLVRASKMLLIK